MKKETRFIHYSFHQKIRNIFSIPKFFINQDSPFFLKIKKEIPFIIGAIPIIWQILFFYIPFALFIISSFLGLHSNEITPTLRHFHEILQKPYFTIILRSLTLATETTLLCLCLGFSLAYCIVFHGGKRKNYLIFLLMIPFWTNFILHIYAWFFMLEQNGIINNALLYCGWIKNPIQFLNSHLAVLVVMVYFYTFLMAIPIIFSLDRLDRSIIEASLDLGANKRQTMRRIIIPLSLPAISSGIFFVFIASFGELIIPEFIGGGKNMLIGHVIFLFLLEQRTETIGIAFTIVSILFLIISLSIIYIILKFINHILMKTKLQEQ